MRVEDERVNEEHAEGEVRKVDEDQERDLQRAHREPCVGPQSFGEHKKWKGELQDERAVAGDAEQALGESVGDLLHDARSREGIVQDGAHGASVDPGRSGELRDAGVGVAQGEEDPNDAHEACVRTLGAGGIHQKEHADVGKTGVSNERVPAEEAREHKPEIERGDAFVFVPAVLAPAEDENERSQRAAGDEELRKERTVEERQRIGEEAEQRACASVGGHPGARKELRCPRHEVKEVDEEKHAKSCAHAGEVRVVPC